MLADGPPAHYAAAAVRPARPLPYAEGSLAVVIPCYRVRDHILPLLGRIGPEVDHIFVIDDACPQNTGAHVLEGCSDRRVVVIFHAENQGVGGAVLTGYQFAAQAGAEVALKLDGDGQMDPALIPQFAGPILEGRADYVKGNRFFNVEDVRTMPKVRLLGNAALSFMTKLSSGYWHLFDPTNGYTAISTALLAHLPLDKVKRRYFFESDMLFRLGTLQASVLDVPMAAVYAGETSSMDLRRVLLPFASGHVGNFVKRVFYNYFLRGFSIATLELLTGLLFLLFGLIYGGIHWSQSIASGTAATTGTVMLAALSVILGVQLLLSFLAFDIAAVPANPVTRLLPDRTDRAGLLSHVRSSVRCGTRTHVP